MWPSLYYTYVYYRIFCCIVQGWSRSKKTKRFVRSPCGYVYLNSNANYYTLHPCFSGKVENYEIGDEDLKTLSLWFQSVNSFLSKFFFFKPPNLFLYLQPVFPLLFQAENVKEQPNKQNNQNREYLVVQLDVTHNIGV